jgi:phosphohistidine phosphatase SixA
VRHGEKQSSERDAALSPAGHTRARCLAETLADNGVTHVVTSEFMRTRDTAGPLATKLGVTPTVVPAADTAAWVDHLNRLPDGSVALVAGHSNTVPELVAALGAGTVAITEDTFDKMFVVVVPERGEPTLVQLRYCSVPGKPPPEAGSMSQRKPKT